MKFKLYQGGKFFEDFDTCEAARVKAHELVAQKPTSPVEIYALALEVRARVTVEETEAGKGGAK